MLIFTLAEYNQSPFEGVCKMASKRNRNFRLKRTKSSRQKRPSKKSLRKIRVKTRVLCSPEDQIRRERVPTTARQYFSRSKQVQEAWDSVGQVISKMRSGRISLRKASKEIGVDPSKVLKLGRSAIRKQKSGKYAAKKTDHLLRILSVLTPEGRREIALRDSRQASCSASIGLRSNDISKLATIRLCANSKAKKLPTRRGNAILSSPT